MDLPSNIQLPRESNKSIAALKLVETQCYILFTINSNGRGEIDSSIPPQFRNQAIQDIINHFNTICMSNKN